MTTETEALWQRLQDEAASHAAATPALAGFLEDAIILRPGFGDALAQLLASQLADALPRTIAAAPLFREVLTNHPAIASEAAADLQKLRDVNPACPDLLSGFVSFRGFQALQLYRVNHALLLCGQAPLAVLLQNWGAIKFGMDLHPEAVIGRGVFLDHGIGLVVGATAVIEDGVNMWHGVTLGSTLTQTGDRHPKVRRDATIGAHAVILGNIEIGSSAVVAAGSVVLEPVPPGCTVAGVPARIVRRAPLDLATIAPDSSKGSRPARPQDVTQLSRSEA